MTYVELHAHSAYSFLDGASQPEELAVRAAELGYEAFALTDHDICTRVELAGSPKPVTDDLVTVAERPVKPGPHALTLRIDIRHGKKSKDSDKLGYVSEHTFAIIVPEGKRTLVAIKGDEDGDAPEYEPEIEVELETLK